MWEFTQFGRRQEVLRLRRRRQQEDEQEEAYSSSSSSSSCPQHLGWGGDPLQQVRNGRKPGVCLWTRPLSLPSVDLDDVVLEERERERERREADL